MNPLLLLLASELQANLPALISKGEAAAAAEVKSLFTGRMLSAKAHVVDVVTRHDGLSLQGTRTITAKDGKTWPEPQEVLRRMLYYAWKTIVRSGEVADVFRDVNTAKELKAITITPDMTPEAAYEAVVAWQADQTF